MRKAHICGGSLIAIAAATMLGQSAFAQTGAPPPKDTSSQGLQEVVVVARRINERLQNVPLTVTAVS
jgi:iron complex outermembrane receptor protein